MAAKKTIAIIASTNEKAATIVNKLSLDNFRLLIVSKYANQFSKLSKDMQSNRPNVELEMINCMKDGCWEADIIIADIPYDEETEVAALIKEVSTQKIVVSFSENENSELQNLLKYSKVVTAINIINSSCISLSGKYQDAIEEVSNILKNSEQSKVTI
jgi:8-hydroxy-5-deazaflavin:NADPH oxidoreductase